MLQILNINYNYYVHYYYFFRQNLFEARCYNQWKSLLLVCYCKTCYDLVKIACSLRVFYFHWRHQRRCMALHHTWNRSSPKQKKVNNITLLSCAMSFFSLSSWGYPCIECYMVESASRQDAANPAFSLFTQAGKMGSSCLLGMSRVDPARKSSPFGHTINPLSTKLAQDGCILASFFH